MNIVGRMVGRQRAGSFSQIPAETQRIIYELRGWAGREGREGSFAPSLSMYYYFLVIFFFYNFIGPYNSKRSISAFPAFPAFLPSFLYYLFSKKQKIYRKNNVIS